MTLALTTHTHITLRRTGLWLWLNGRGIVVTNQLPLFSERYGDRWRVLVRVGAWRLRVTWGGV